MRYWEDRKRLGQLTVRGKYLQISNTYFSFKLEAAIARQVDWAGQISDAISTFRCHQHFQEAPPGIPRIDIRAGMGSLLHQAIYAGMKYGHEYLWEEWANE